MTLNLRVSTPEDVVVYELRDGKRAVIVADLRDYEDMFRDKHYICEKPFLGFVLNDRGGLYEFDSWTVSGRNLGSATEYDLDIIRVYNKDCKCKQELKHQINDLIDKLKALKGEL